ncbi:MAG TPA: heavy-metal-associated domain-containing protein [Actinocrinis sp.]|nr:heavy-metal-associated domain-containing protein [Actinocrinis sp.]
MTQQIAPRPQNPADAPVTNVYTVTGMTCGHCAGSVTAQLERLDGVTAVHVDVAAGRVTVGSTGPLALADVRAAVDEAGYALS